MLAKEIAKIVPPRGKSPHVRGGGGTASGGLRVKSNPPNRTEGAAVCRPFCAARHIDPRAPIANAGGLGAD